jgi:peptidoglycan/xylan/chitin deacetylase (PgdA/CDA1 family)
MQLLAVNYHYFREKSPLAGFYPTTVADFEREIRLIKHKYRILSQTELTEILRSKQLPLGKYAIVTFDDGLKEQINALQVLRQLDLEGIFYPSTDPIKNNAILSVHKLHQIRAVFSDSFMLDMINDKYSSLAKNLDPEFVKNQYRYDTKDARTVKYIINFVMNSEDRDKFIDEIYSMLPREDATIGSQFYMSNEDIIKLASFGMLGTHCASHRPLATISSQEAYKDIEDSLLYFKELGIDNLPSISYPYGGETAVNEEISSIAARFNFSFGLTMMRGVNDVASSTCNRMLLRRISSSDLGAYI